METCADCGKPITSTMLSYYSRANEADIGNTYHSECGPYSPSGKDKQIALLTRERDQAREALEPFAEAYRVAHAMGAMSREYFSSMCCTGRVSPQDFARADEITRSATSAEGGS